MGYTTDFVGSIEVSPALTDEHKEFIDTFAATRRMKRNPDLAEKLSDKIRENAKLPIGEEGANFVGGKGFAGQDHDDSVIEHNDPPKGQPSLWCQWVSSEDGDAIIWDGGEKFYYYTEWLEYIIENYLRPWGYTLNGEIEWCGEDYDDRGMIVVDDNDVSSRIGRVVYE
jgi:hypothetical protein